MYLLYIVYIYTYNNIVIVDRRNHDITLYSSTGAAHLSVARRDVLGEEGKDNMNL